MTGTAERPMTRADPQWPRPSTWSGCTPPTGRSRSSMASTCLLGAGRVLALLGPTGPARAPPCGWRVGGCTPSAAGSCAEGQDVDQAGPAASDQDGHLRHPRRSGCVPKPDRGREHQHVDLRGPGSDGPRPRSSPTGGSLSWPTGAASRPGTLSGGEQQEMLAIVRALCVKPSILLLGRDLHGPGPPGRGRPLRGGWPPWPRRASPSSWSSSSPRPALNVADEAVVLSQGRIEVRAGPTRWARLWPGCICATTRNRPNERRPMGRPGPTGPGRGSRQERERT